MFLDEVFPLIMKAHDKTLTPQQLRDSITPVNIQNVADYFYAHSRDWVDEDGDARDDAKFPNVRLPWPTTWFEWEGPGGLLLGALLKEFEYKKPKTPEMALNEVFFNNIAELERTLGLEQDTRIVLTECEIKSTKLVSLAVYASCYVRAKYVREVSIPQAVAYCHDEDGVMEPRWHKNVSLVQGLDDLTWTGPIWLAISLAHCKNTTFRDKEPMPDKIQRARVRRKKAPYFQFKTLNIGSAKQYSKDSKINQEDSTPKALHICRGHFKDFSNGKGLFGRNKGLYWWPMHTRGDKENGLIIKDYRVEPGVE